MLERLTKDSHETVLKSDRLAVEKCDVAAFKKFQTRTET